LQDTVSSMQYDLTHIMSGGSVQWFNVAAYNPTHALGDLMVTYQ